MAADPITKNTIDELLSYDFSDDGDPFNDKPSKKRDDKAVLSPRGTKRSADDNKENFGGLGLDEEVKIVKKRAPNPKLDEQRLLSNAGIPKLRNLSRSGKVAKRLHLKGKGHEFSDVAKLLNYYQLWLDDLFPRAKFADGLVIIEKVGHSKRMAINRKQWIDEGKPGYARDKHLRKEQEEYEKANEDGAPPPKPSGDENEDLDDMFFADFNKDKEATNGDLPEDDELDALLAEQAARVSPQKPLRQTVDSEGEDDLDALLAEQESRRNPAISSKKAVNEPVNDDDDLDALLAEQESRSAPKAAVQTRPRNTVFDEDDEDDDALDALLVDQNPREQATAPLAVSTSPAKATAGKMTSPERNLEKNEQEDVDNALSSPLPNNPEEEDLDDFLSSPIPNEE